MPVENQIYDAAFFDEQGPGSLRSAQIVLRRVFQWLHPDSVVDVGCGTGGWLSVAQALGVSRIVGFDGDYVDRAAMRIALDDFIPAELDRQNPADMLPEGERFDLVISLEVAEHLPHARSAAFVEALTALGDAVLFSAAVPYQNGTGHINEQWPEFWASLFRAQGYHCFDPLRDALWSDDDVEWWYAQNILLFAREGSEAAAALPRESLSDGQALSRIHPHNFLLQILSNYRRHRASAREHEAGDYSHVVRGWMKEGPAFAAPYAPQFAAEHPDREDVFPETRTALGDPEADIAALGQQVKRAEEQAMSLQEQLSQAREQVSWSQEQWSRARDEIVALRLHSEEADLLGRQLTACLEASRERIAVLEGQLAAAGVRADAERHAAAQALAGAQGQGAEAEAMVARLRASSSWRITKPLRCITNWVRGRR